MNFTTIKTEHAPWMESLEMQMQTLSVMRRIVTRAEEARREGTLSKATRAVLPTLTIDAGMLAFAETYSIAGMARDAILQAAQSVPGDVVLTPQDVPGTGAGWWYITPHIDLKTTLEDAPVAAVLWGFAMQHDLKDVASIKDVALEEMTDKGFINFSLYVPITTKRGVKEMRPSACWRWRFGLSLDEELEAFRKEHQTVYGKDGDFKDVPITGEDEFIHAVRCMMQFYIAGCAWLGQKVLVEGAGHVQRTRAKQMERELKLDYRPSNVKVIELRKREYVRSEETEAKVGTRTFHCQWVVDGHWRNQPCGPKRSERRLLWIAPYVKGPADMPLTEKRRVFSVVR